MFDSPFVTGTKVLINNNEYLIRKRTNNDFELENLSYNNIEIWSKNELLHHWLDERLIFHIDYDLKSLKECLFEDLDEVDMSEAKRRYKILKPVLDGEVLPSETLEYLASLDEKVGKTQFYEWKKRWNKYNDIRALVPFKRGSKKPRLSVGNLDMVDEVIKEFAYSGEKYTLEDIYSEYLIRLDDFNEFRDDKEKLKKVSKSKVYQRKIEIIDKYKVDSLKHGTVLAKLMKNGAKSEVNVDRPLQRVEIDWTPVDVMLIDPTDLKPKRPTLIYAVDKFSGHPLGFYTTFGGVDVTALKQCLLHCIMPKTYIKDLYPLVENTWDAYGIPKTIVLDNASVNESFDLEDTCLQLGIQNIQYCAVGAGHQKGTIERAFRSLNTKFIHNLKGTTFSNFLEKGIYDSGNKSCITMQGFIYMAHIAMVDLVSHQYNSRLGNTPSKIWELGIKNTAHQIIHLPRNFSELRLLLMGGTSIRKITNKGIVIKNEYYNSFELMEFKNYLEKHKLALDVRVRYDLSDMRMIYIYDQNNNKYIKAEPTGFYRKNIDDS